MRARFVSNQVRLRAIDRAGVLAICLLTLVGQAFAQDRDKEDQLQLPVNPLQWINSKPISVETMRGKAAVLYFFEEQCPKCRAKWPELLETATKFQGQPIVFIAVNSGSPPSNVKRYATSNRVRWPMIVDFDRSVEKQFGVPEISLKNIAQVRGVRADGSVALGSLDKLESFANGLLKDASWNVDPADIPESLQPAWAGVEFGNFPAAARPIAAGLKSSKDDVKAAAQRLQDYVQAKLDKVLEDAKNAETEGDVWKAHAFYNQALNEFKGFDMPAEVKNTAKKLASNPTVKKEIAAAKKLAAAKRMATSPAGRVRAIRLLEGLIKSAPDTEAGRTALRLVIELGG